jgi:hypothetical protein
MIMSDRNSTGVVAVTLAAALTMMFGGSAAAKDAKYPDWTGQWLPVNAQGTAGGSLDPTKPAGPGQQAPLTPEYKKILEDSMAVQANGGLGNDPTAQCYAAGMPRMMAYQAQEYVVTPDVTYILLGGDDHLRRIITDGRDWPAKLNPTYQGYSIGHWIDTAGDGAYDVLEAETRGPFRGPRAYDSTGLPLAFDNQSTFKERFFIDKADPNLLHDVITVLDHALTQPWTVDKTFRRNADSQPDWPEDYCHVTNRRIVLDKEVYLLNDEGILMPTRKDQPPPDFRYFKPASK